MRNIFLAPRSGKKSAEHFRKTIQYGFQKRDIESHLSEEDKQALEERDILCIWGNRGEGRRPWAKMEKGDYVFFYQEGKITWIGELLYKTHNKTLADALWEQYVDGDKRESYEYVFFLENLREVEIDFALLKDFAGYKPNAVVFGFQSYRERGIKNLLEKHGSIENFIDTYKVDKSTVEEVEIDPAEFIEIMRRYNTEGTVFQSVTKGARYYIESVDDAGCVVNRIDASEPARCTASGYEKKKELLRNSGGTYRFNDFDGTAAKRVTYLQALPFGIGSDRETILDLSDEDKALDAFCDLVKNLKVDAPGGEEKLYKPAMLACVIEGLETGDLTENRIEFDWIAPKFIEKMRALREDVSEKQAATAFYHLTGDLFWMLSYHDANRPFDIGTPGPADIRRRVKHASIKDTFWRVLQLPGGQEAVMNALEERWWRTDQQQNILQNGLEAILAKYEAARLNDRFGRQHELWDIFKSLQKALEADDIVRERPHIKIKWSVGQAIWAKVPWISFLDERETTTTQRGVYCVLLFRQDMSGVYLTFNQGVTEPQEEHGRREGKRLLRSRAEDLRRQCPELLQYGFTLDDQIDLRADRGLGSDYEDSTIAYKLYESGSVPDDETIVNDLEILLEAYERYIESRIDDGEVMDDLSAIHAEFSEALRASNILFGPRHDEVVRSFIASLATKRFVILTGLSGSGKTQMAIKFGEWLGNERSCVVPVRPDWTGSEALFGYEDALQIPSEDGRRAWYVPDILRFILKAARDPKNPYLIVLDEMNLAHVERYFADVLSGMESMQPCLPNLREEDDGHWRLVQGAKDKITYPKNLFIVGTVNVDETTYMFSPKVLDRANTFEFRVDTEDLSIDAQKPTPCETGDQPLVRGFLAIAEDDSWHLENPANGLESFVENLRSLHGLLSDDGFEFGHRVFYEAIRFAAMHNAAGDTNPDHALDLQVIQKILPRLHGSRRRLEPALCALGQFCFDLTIDLGAHTREGGSRFDPLAAHEEEARLPISFDKIRRMTRSLRANQFVSFTE